MLDETDSKIEQSLDRAQQLVHEAMKDVKQELVIVGRDGRHHIAYIFNVEIVNGQLAVQFSTPSEEDITELVHEAMHAQLVQAGILSDINNVKVKQTWFAKVMTFLRSLKARLWKNTSA